jgi:hypothetical protein
MSKPLAAGAALLLIVSSSPAAPALGDKPTKWEYAELNIQRSTTGGLLLRPIQPGGAAPAPAPAPEITIRFATGDEEVTARTWEELADKLKAPAAKKEGTPTVHKLRVLNRLGADGWELAEHTGTDGTIGTANWVFKRKLP